MNTIHLVSTTFYSLFSLTIALTGVGLVIAFHEFGHCIFAKILNIHVPSFSIGFGPKILKKTIGETEYSISAIPFGGYVEISNDPTETATNGKKRLSFAHTSWLQKVFVILGGIGFNILLSYILFTLVFISGAPQSGILFPLNAQPHIRAIAPQSSADTAGLQKDDLIIAVNGISIENSLSKLIQELNKFENSRAPLDIVRHTDSTKPALKKTILVDIGPKNFLGHTLSSLGVAFYLTKLAPFSFFKAIKHGIRLTNTFFINTCRAFASLLTKKSSTGANLVGPISMISSTADAVKKGIKDFLLFLAFISISLAPLNLIPLPVLDGGQMLFFSIEALIRRPLPEKLKDYIGQASWMLLMGLTLYLSLKDIMSIANPYIEKVLAFLGIGG